MRVRFHTRLGRDFQLFFGGQLTSQLGSSMTSLLLPLIVFELTGSALSLGLTAAAQWLPYLFFGLAIGAYVDRLPRRLLMLGADIGRAAAIGSIPVLAIAGHLPVWWIYVVGFISSTLAIIFDTAEVAAIPCMVRSADLVVANGRVQAAYSATGVIGPLLGGALLGLLHATAVLWVDAASFLVSTATLVLVRTSFDPKDARGKSRMRDDIAEGLRFVLRNPVLRSISAMMAIINLVQTSTFALLVLFAKRQLAANDQQIGILFAAGSAGVVIFGLLAGRIRRRFSFSQAIIGSLVAGGVLIVGFALCPWYPLSVVLWAACVGVGIFFNINTTSLRQRITPPDMLGRIMSIASVLAWSAIPLGTLAGGALVSAGVDVGALYLWIGVVVTIVPLLFALGPLGHAERYLPTAHPVEPTPEPATAQ